MSKTTQIALSQKILRTHACGMPLEWINYQQAVRLYHLGVVTYAYGTSLYCIRGGHNARSGARSEIELSSIIATRGDPTAVIKSRQNYTAPLNNPALFKRDGHICMYCGQTFEYAELSRDHVHPLSLGGRDIWTNVVTACKRCNHRKANKRPENAGMELLAVPFKPTYAEYIYLQGRKILADQMEFLKAHFPRKSPLRSRTHEH